MLMAYCPKCGTKVEEEMAFCPKCGAPLKAEKPREWREERRAEKREKAEKAEKHEKKEKTEKYEKREFGVIGPLIGGLILIFLGLMFYLEVIGYNVWEYGWAFFIIILGILIIVGTIYATRRYPRP